MTMTTVNEMKQLYDMITKISLRRLGVNRPGIVPGAPADLVVLDAANVQEALRIHEPPKWVISRGGNPPHCLKNLVITYQNRSTSGYSFYDFLANGLIKGEQDNNHNFVT